MDTVELHNEVFRFPESCPHEVDSALECLQYIHKEILGSNYPNLSITLAVLLTIPVTVSSGKRSFSKLKFIRNYLCSTMC